MSRPTPKLNLGGNTFHRLCRPAWTSETKSGMLGSFNHRDGKDLERGFFVLSGGEFRKPRKSVRSQGKKGGGNDNR